MLALPWYGLAWSTQSDGAGAPVRSGKGMPTAADGRLRGGRAQGHRGGRRYDTEQASAWTAYADQAVLELSAPPGDRSGTTTPTASGPRSSSRSSRVSPASASGPWHGRVAEEMWWALRNQLQPRLDDAPPNGSAALDSEAIRGDIDGLDVVSGCAPLRLFAADDVDGSGLVLVRIGLDGELDEDGLLVIGRSYPAVERIDFPLGDAETGGSTEDGPRSIHVQWRDVAGNWSVPVVIEAHVLDPSTTDPGRPLAGVGPEPRPVGRVVLLAQHQEVRQPEEVQRRVLGHVERAPQAGHPGGHGGR